MESQANVALRFNEHKFCRLCLSCVYELRTLIPNKPGGPDMITKIHTLTEVIIVPPEEQYSRICIRCIKQLEELDLFRRRCKDSDNQIRKIREQQRSGKVSGSPLEGRSEVTTNKFYRSIFDRLQYCADAMIPGEYRIVYGGNFYRSNSFRVWKCEQDACHCLMIIKHDLCSISFLLEHSHVVKDTTSLRKIIGMDPRVIAFLSNLEKRYSYHVQDPSKGRHDSNLLITQLNQAARSVTVAKNVQIIQPRVPQIQGLNMYQLSIPKKVLPGSIIKIISPNPYTTMLPTKCKAPTVPLTTASATTQPINSNEQTLSSVLNRKSKEQVSTQNYSSFCSTPKSSGILDGESAALTRVKVKPALKQTDVLQSEQLLLLDESGSKKEEPSDMKCEKSIRFADKTPSPKKTDKRTISTMNTLTTTENHGKSRAELVDELFKQIHSTLQICKSKTHTESTSPNVAKSKPGEGSLSPPQDDVEETQPSKNNSTLPRAHPESSKIHTSAPKKRKAQLAGSTKKSKLFKAGQASGY